MEIQANWELVIMLVPYNPVGLLVHLVEHWIGIAEVMGSNPVRARIFFQALFFTTAQVVLATAKIAFIFTSLSAVHRYDFHTFTVNGDLF